MDYVTIHVHLKGKGGSYLVLERTELFSRLTGYVALNVNLTTLMSCIVAGIVLHSHW